MRNSRSSAAARCVLTGSIAAVVSLAAVPSAKAALLYWDTNDVAVGSGAATGTWGTSNFWTTDATGATATTAYVAGSDVIFSAGTNGTTGTVTVSGTQVANSITFDDPVAITISGGTSLTLGGATGEGIFATANNSAANIISTPLVLNTGAAPIVQNAGAGLLTLGAITGAATGTNSLTFASTGAGGITDAGVLANGAGGALTVNINGTGAGPVTLSGASTYTGGLNLLAGTLKTGAVAGSLGGAANQVTINGGTLLSGGAATFTQPVAIGASGGTISTVGSLGKAGFTGALTGTGTLTRTGDAVTQFTGTATSTTNDVQFAGTTTGFSGAVVLNGGNTEVTNSLGSGTVTINSGAELQTGGTNANTLVINNGAFLSGVGANRTFTGAITANPGIFKVRLGDFYQAQPRSLTLSGPLTGSGLIELVTAPSLNPAGQSLTLSGNNAAYSGKITATAGHTVNFGSAASLGTGGLAVQSNDGQLGALGFNYDFGPTAPAFTNTRFGANVTGGVFGVNAVLAPTTSLNLATLGGGGMFLGSTGTGTYSSTTLGADGAFYRLGGGGGTLTLSGTNALTGPASLIVGDPRVNGGGTVVLAAAASYTGSTEIDNGGLNLNFGAAGAPTDDMIPASSALTLRLGTLTLTGRAGGSSTQNFASTSVTGNAIVAFVPSGTNVIQVNHNAITRTAGAILTESSITATASYATGGIATTTNTNNAAGLLGSWAFAGSGVNTRFATVVSGQILGIAATPAADASGLTDTTGLVNYDLAAATGTTPASVSANTVRYTGAAATLAPGATLFQVNGLLNAGTGAWTIGTNKITVGSDSELVVNAASAAVTISSIIGDGASASAVTVTGPNAVTLSGVNTFSNGLNVTSGTVSFNANTNLGAATKPIALNAGTLNSTLTTGNVVLDHPITVGPNGGTLVTAGSGTAGKISLGAGTLTGSGTFTHSGGADLQISGANPGFSGQFNVFALTEASIAGALGTGTINVGVGGELSILISVPLTNPFILNGGTLSGQNATSGGTVTIPSTTTINAAGDFRLALRAFQDNTRVFGFTLAAPISGNGSLSTAVGTNATNNRQIVLLSGDNSAWNGNVSTAGASASNGVTIRLGSPTALGTSIGTTTIAANSTLDLNGVTLANAEPLIIGGSGPTIFPTALTNENAAAATFSGPITLTANTILGSTNGGAITLSGAIGGAFGLTKIGSSSAQTITLSGANTFTGNVSIAGGPLVITNSSALGTGTKTISIIPTTNPTSLPSLQLDGSAGDINLPASMSFTTSYDALNTGVPIAGAGAIVNVAGNNTINGNFSLTSGGGGTTFLANAGKLTIAGNISAATTARSVVLRGAGTGEISGAITNGSAVLPVIRDAGTGVWTLSNPNNSYTGSTSVSAGSLVVTGSLTGTTALAVSGGAILQLSGASETLGGTPSVGSVNNSASVTLGGATAGTLKLSGTAQTETLAALTLNTGATLDFGGANGGPVSTNAFVFSTLTLSGTGISVLHWSGSLYDVSGPGDSGGPNQDRLLFTSSLTDGLASQISFFDDSGSPLGYGHVIPFTSGSFTGFEIVPIPEPAALGGLLSAAALLGSRRRRNARA